MNGCNCWGPDGGLDTKIDKFDLCHISMSYASYVRIWHIMSYDAYDIDISYKSIWLILVSKQPSGPQQSHLCIQFWQTNLIKLKKIEISVGYFSLYKFWKSFVFSAIFSTYFWTLQSIQNIKRALNSVSPYKIVSNKHIAVIPSWLFSSLTRPTVHIKTVIQWQVSQLVKAFHCQVSGT
jgi:hypothetical protein